ncbi:MAG TPA: hypothetical protein VKU36_00855 [Candidatus Babeliales bacterium]|nr:hypothetical protein [Candidatus Babeliales bacterium]
MKKFISMMLFYITCIALQTNAMELDKLSNDKESITTQHLLSPVHTSRSAEVSENTTRYQNNYLTLLPLVTPQNTIILPVIFPLNRVENEEIREKKDEIYEVIPLDNTTNDKKEESSPQNNNNSVHKVCAAIIFLTAAGGAYGYMLYSMINLLATP